MKLVALALAFAIGPFNLVAQSVIPAPCASPSNFNVVIGNDRLSKQFEQRIGNLLETVMKGRRFYMATGIRERTARSP